MYAYAKLNMRHTGGDKKEIKLFANGSIIVRQTEICQIHQIYAKLL